MDISVSIGDGIFNFRTGVILIDKDRVLLHQKEGDDFWALPGGRVSMFESSMDSAVREIREEIGVEIMVDRMLWHTENFFLFEEKKFHEIADYYVATICGNEIQQKDVFEGIEGEETLIYKWFPIEDLKNVELYPEFLREGISNLPDHPTFLTITQEGS
ncbi:NUDIX hydrolase [Ornithinibacillus scapharcae]|uniref:NUDIX hydrolase n=1 Tax=Ornithinibacillus scapharcae TaxID=1147159 RepID=UPI000225AD7F|nr:NUDIX hydrolase [Ornithinibacillus scapharcae]